MFFISSLENVLHIENKTSIFQILLNIYLRIIIGTTIRQTAPGDTHFVMTPEVLCQQKKTKVNNIIFNK